MACWCSHRPGPMGRGTPLATPVLRRGPFHGGPALGVPPRGLTRLKRARPSVSQLGLPGGVPPRLTPCRCSQSPPSRGAGRGFPGAILRREELLLFEGQHQG